MMSIFVFQSNPSLDLSTCINTAYHFPFAWRSTALSCTFRSLTGRTSALPSFPIIALLFKRYNSICHSFFLLLINHHSISHNRIGTDCIASFSYCIPRVSFYSIDHCSVTSFHDSHMVTCSIMVPVKKDDCTETWHTASSLPASLILEPVLSIRTKEKLGYITILDQSCLICTPGHEAGTPEVL